MHRRNVASADAIESEVLGCRTTETMYHCRAPQEADAVFGACNVTELSELRVLVDHLIFAEVLMDDLRRDPLTLRRNSALAYILQTQSITRAVDAMLYADLIANSKILRCANSPGGCLSSGYTPSGDLKCWRLFAKSTPIVIKGFRRWAPLPQGQVRNS